MWWRPAASGGLLDRLHDIGLLRRDTDDDGRYGVGPQFLGLIMFLGCAPNVPLAPAAGGAEPCTIRMLSFATPVLVSAQPMPAVRCRRCRAAVGLPCAYDFTTRYRCANCGAAGTLAELDWRQGAGWARLFLDISGIYPHEAVPSDALLEQLAEISGGGWKYFFATVASSPD